MDPQDFGFLDPDPWRYADPRIRIQVAKYQLKTAKINPFLLSKPKSELLNKDVLKFPDFCMVKAKNKPIKYD